MEPNYAADCLFLEPPHAHDPSNVSHIAALPPSILSQLSEDMQDALRALQESTSVVYASYLRLQALLEERFNRLIPIPGMSGSYSETSFFNYINALSAERSYLLHDAHPDWKHKARQAGILSPTPCANLRLIYRGKAITIGQWIQQLSAAESLWVDTARDLELPGFDATIKEYQSLSDSESASSTPTEASVSEDERWGNNAPVSVVQKAPNAVDPWIGMWSGNLAHKLGQKSTAMALEAL